MYHINVYHIDVIMCVYMYYLCRGKRGTVLCVIINRIFFRSWLDLQVDQIANFETCYIVRWSFLFYISMSMSFIKFYITIRFFVLCLYVIH